MSSKSSKKRISKKSSKLSKKIGSVNKLYKELEKLSNDYEELILLPNTNQRKENVILEKIEGIRIKLSSVEKNMYPSIYSSNFSEQLFQMKDFNINKIPFNEKRLKELYKEYEETKKSKKISKNKIKKESKKKRFELSNTQLFLKNFMNEKTPYRGLLIFHDTGVGKTCTGITIAESLKKFVKDFKKKIHIIRYEEFKSQIFNYNLLHKGDIKYQCTGDEYKKELMKMDKENEDLFRQCKENEIYCKGLIDKINKLIRNYYDFKNLEKFARDADKLINKENKYQSKKELHLEKIAEIKKEFSNSIIIIDEAHHINDTTYDLDTKLIANVLHDILKYGDNIRLILLTATPLWDKPTEIISLINFLLVNDNRATLQTKDIFNNDSSLKKDGEKILRNKIRGYISFLRGNNPLFFPFRLNCSINVPELIIKKYPTKMLENENNFYKNKIKFETFDIIDTPMLKDQLKVYKETMKLKKKKEEISTVYSAETQISNFVYQSLEEAKDDIQNCYGESGFKSIFKKTQNGTYRFKNEEYGKRFIGENLKNYSNKIYTLIKNIKKCDGPSFVFSKYVWGGLFPVIIALEMNGYKLYKSNIPYIENKYKLTEYKGDFIIKSGSIKSKSINTYISKKEKMINEPVKVFLGTATAAEGLNLYGYREVHILEPHFNFSLLEQVIGRTTRKQSHFSLPITKRNVVIYLYASTLGKDESIDLYKYRLSQEKAYLIGDITKLIKEEAIDCMLNFYGNNIIYDKYKGKKVQMITSHNKKINITLNDSEYSKFCDYKKKCEYKCNGEMKILTKKNIKLINNINKLVKSYEFKIVDLLMDNYMIKIDDLIEMLDIKDEEICKIAILNILKDDKIYKNEEERGKIILNGNFLKFVKLESMDKDIEFIEQYYKKKKKIDEIDLSYYINKLKTKDVKDTSLNVKQYKNLLNKFYFNYDNIKNNLYSKQILFTENLTLSNTEIVDYLFVKLVYFEKLIFLQNIILKLIKKNELSIIENFIKKIILDRYIIYKNDFKSTSSKKEIYGFIINNFKELNIYKFNKSNDKFVLDNAYNIKIIDNLIDKLDINNFNYNNIYSYNVIDNKNGNGHFKIVDASFSNKKSQKGSKCIDKSKLLIDNYYKLLLNKKFTKIKKNIMCNDLEILFKRKNEIEKKKWYLNEIEYLLVTEYNK